MMYGQSQFVRSCAPPPLPRPDDSGGRIGFDWPVRMFMRSIAPFCDEEYTVVGSSGSIWLKKPSPPPDVTQSLVSTPRAFDDRDGPHIDPLSCAPPHTW